MAQPPPFPARLPPPFRAFPPPFPGPTVRPAPFPVGPAAPPPFFLPPPASEGGPRFPPGVPYLAAAAPRAAAEEEAAQRQHDELWLSQFLGRRRSAAPPPPPPAAASPSSARAVAVAALGRVARVAALCRALRRCEDGGDEPGWARAREEAEAELQQLREVVRPLREPGYEEALRRKTERARKRRLRLQRRKHEARVAKEEEAARAAEREAKIDQWRAKCIQEVEEKNRERELKAAADSVLSEVRKKQADTKRMMDILRGLEKLRKLRKEAAARKGVCPPPSADEAFENQVESLKTLLKTRTELYEAEERALRVMLEGEQEEERKREMEKKQKKEREKLLQQKLEMDSKLFGDPAARNQAAAMSYLDEVPFRMAVSLSGDSEGEIPLVTAPDIELPDCTDILMSTMHDFSLERKVLYWVEVASQQQTSRHRVTSEIVPTAPPCWLLLVDPTTDSYSGRGRDGAVRRSISLSAGRAVLSDTESDTWHSEEGEYSDDEYSSTSWEDNDRDETLLSRRRSFYQTRPKTSPCLLEPSPENNVHSPASPDPSKQRRSMVIFNNMKNELEAARRKLAALVHPLNRAATGSRGIPVPRLLPQCPGTNRSVKYGADLDVSQQGTAVPTPPATPIPPIKQHKPTVPSLSPYTCLPPACTPGRPLSCHRSQPDSSADLLSALSQEERDLIEPVIALGYPTQKAILTLQKTGRQSLSQFLSYLGACDRLLKQGYEEGQVEEAMEMFQYSEKKAAEFLHLLAQFNDMGFQQNEIKEVLLLCGNQRERALEELVMKTH
ncbi:hypothetical protein HGM15179_003454 [Zosterops borbonicus]|uniref:Ubiquitin associated protein 1 like n=1 Tax=Zosterops borbonicus TaxID=364589 RepID=A0A8K1GQZ3_9PASS|nr:hypothetical protein HGM15179_003454 [Zosterops borbonicus]